MIFKKYDKLQDKVYELEDRIYALFNSYDRNVANFELKFNSLCQFIGVQRIAGSVNFCIEQNREKNSEFKKIHDRIDGIYKELDLLLDYLNLNFKIIPKSPEKLVIEKVDNSDKRVCVKQDIDR